MFDKSRTGIPLSRLLHTQEHILAGCDSVCVVEAKNNLCVAQPVADGGVLAQQSPERSRAKREDESCLFAREVSHNHPIYISQYKWMQSTAKTNYSLFIIKVCGQYNVYYQKLS